MAIENEMRGREYADLSPKLKRELRELKAAEEKKKAAVAKGKIPFCDGKMDLRITGNCAVCKRAKRCYERSFGDVIKEAQQVAK